MAYYDIDKLMQGNIDEFESFIKVYQEAVMQISMSVIQNLSYSRHVAILVFKEIYQHINELNRYDIKNWIYRKAYTISKEYTKENNSFNIINEDKDNIFFKKNINTTDGLNVSKDIYSALLLLKNEQRELIYLRDVFLFDFNEIKEMTQLSDCILSSRINCARSSILNSIKNKWQT